MFGKHFIPPVPPLTRALCPVSEGEVTANDIWCIEDPPARLFYVNVTKAIEPEVEQRITHDAFRVAADRKSAKFIEMTIEPLEIVAYAPKWACHAQK